MKTYNLSNSQDRKFISDYVTTMNAAYDSFIDSLSLKQYQAWTKLANKENSNFEYTLTIDSITKSSKIHNLFNNWISLVIPYRNEMKIIEEDTNYLPTEYNGHKNYQTWNVSLFIGNELSMYSIATRCETYKEFTDKLLGIGIVTTPDNVSLSDKDLDFSALNELIESIE